MEAVEFLNNLKRMCKTYDNCDECPLHNISQGCYLPYPNMEADKTVEAVEKWSKEHPIKTNKDVCKEVIEKYFPNVLFTPICAAFDMPKLFCNKDCKGCQKFWNSEYKENKEEQK